jgi:hypothetical protein
MGANDRRQPDDVITAGDADVRDGHPVFDAEQTHELARLADCVALFHYAKSGQRYPQRDDRGLETH